jgi:hypothetical protein
MRLFNWLKNLGKSKKKDADTDQISGCYNRSACKCGKQGYYVTVYNDHKLANGFPYTETLCLDCMKVLCDRGCVVAL